MQRHYFDDVENVTCILPTHGSAKLRSKMAVTTSHKGFISSPNAKANGKFISQCIQLTGYDR